METTGRHAEALKREIHELMVEDKTMSMTEIKVFKGIVQLKREIHELMVEDKTMSMTEIKVFLKG